MKNSKVLSLLTAGALVVSSFSGLVIGGGVAYAADGDITAPAAIELTQGKAGTDGLYFVDTTAANTTATTMFTLGAGAAGVAVGTSNAIVDTATAALSATKGASVGSGNVGTYVTTNTNQKEFGATWNEKASGVDYIATTDVAGNNVTNASKVVYGLPLVVNGTPVRSGYTYYAAAGETFSVGINPDLAAAMAYADLNTGWKGTYKNNGIDYTGGDGDDTVAKTNWQQSITVEPNLAGEAEEVYNVKVKGDVAFTLKVKASAMNDISNRLTFTETGFSNEQSVVAWPNNQDVSKSFVFDDSDYLDQVFFGENVTNTTIEIDYKLTNADANSNLEIVGGKTVQTTPKVSEKRETFFNSITVKGKSTSRATLTVDGKATVSEYVTVNGTQTLVTHPYQFTKKVELVAGTNVKVDMNNGYWDTTAVNAGQQYAYVIGAIAPLTAEIVEAPSQAVNPAYATADVEFRLKNTTYLEVKGSPAFYRDRWTKRKVVVPTALVGDTGWKGLTDKVEFELTDTAKASVTDVSTELYATIKYYNADDEEIGYASSTITITLKANTDFTIALKNPSGEDYDSTFVWDVDDVASATKDVREFYVRSNTTGYDLGANGNPTTQVFFAESGDSKGNWDVQFANANGTWTSVYGYNNDGSPKNNTTSGAYLANTNLFRIRTEGKTDATAKLTVTAVYGNGSSLKRAVTTYDLKSQIAGISIDVQTYWAVGETLNLRDDVVVKYNGEAVSNTSGIVEWTLTDVGNAEVGRLGDVLTFKKAGEKFKINATYRKASTNTTAQASKELTIVKKLTLAGVDADLAMLTGESIDLTAALAATGATKLTSADATVARVIGNTVTGMKAGATTLRFEDADHNYAEVALTVGGADPSEHYAGEPVAEDGVIGYLNEDLATVTVTDAVVTSKAITIPATIDGFPVVAIDPQAFKKTDAKTVYVVGSVDTIGKGAFKASKVKKVYFYDPAALKTVGKNAFKKTNAKVVGVAGSFDEGVAKDLEKAGAKSVKNNGTAK